MVLIVSVICFYASHLIGYREVALLLLMTVSLLAILFEILPVLTASVLSAFTWNFFFIPPVFTFHISSTEDTLMFLLYFFIALVNAVLTFKIRKEEDKARDQEEKEHTIRLYNTLLNSLSHELKTPISTILGAVDTLKEEGFSLKEESRAELLSEIGKAGMRLNRQVENLLNMSRLESGMLKPKNDWSDIRELLYRLVQKTEAPKHQVVFQPAENLPLFRLDAGLLEQVIDNLVHNAVQYTPEQSIITITAAYTPGKCMITVSDNGKGFPVSEMQHVFEKFYRLPETKAGGSGLGLSIVKGFTSAMHGEVKLQNNRQGGAEFTISIPAETSFINHLKNE